VSYPSVEFRDDSQGTSEVAIIGAHDEGKHIAASTTAKAIEDLFVRMNIEGWMTLAVEWAQAEELTT
jgi:hypothetical protein